MSNYIKLFLIALGVVILLTIIIIFSVPSVRKSVLGSKDGEGTEKEISEKELSESASQIKFKVGDKVIDSKQVYDFAEELRKREALVIEKEKRIERRLLTLETEKKEINSLKVEVKDLYDTIAQYLPVITEGEKKNLKKLAKMFETLSPETASPIMSRMPDQTLVIVLSFMKARNSANLLGGYAAISPESARRAAILTEKLKHMVIK